MEYVFNGLRNNRNMICLSRCCKLKEKHRIIASFLVLIKGVCDLFCGWPFGKKCRTYSNREYYRRYYFVMKNGYCDHISILEGHVAFLRNMILIVLSYGLVFAFNDKEYFDYYVCSCGWWLIILAFLMFIVMVFKQQKI